MARVSRGRLILDFRPVVSGNLWQPLLFGGAAVSATSGCGFERFRITKQFTRAMVVYPKIASPRFFTRSKLGVGGPA